MRAGYRPTFALYAVGRNDAPSLDIARTQMQALADCLTICDRAYLKYERIPDVLNGRIRYDKDRPPRGSACGDDDWTDIKLLNQRGIGDCDDLACARAAQLQQAGIAARAIPLLRRSNGSHDYHIVVMWPQGLSSYPPTVYKDPSGSGLLLEDPSRLLGMR